MKTPPAPVAHELRVLDGPQRGACVALEPGRAYRVGRRWGCDVLLRAQAGDDGTELSLTLQADGRLLLQVQAGRVRCGRRELEPGQALALPALQPLEVDGVRLAAGPLGSPAWVALLEGGAPPPAPEPARPDELRQRLHRWGRWLRLGGAALAAASLSMFALAMVATPAAPTPAQQARQAQALLASAGFTAVEVAPESGGLLVKGYLETQAQRTRAEQLLAGQGLAARLDVWVNEAIAHAIQDVYRVHGVKAEVQPTGAGAMRVRTALADPAPLAGIERLVRRDVPGLHSLQPINEAPRHTPSPIPALDDPGKRVASIVAGAEPYVVTVDGTRYFVGAMLPTGHRIESIDGSRVELEREGERSAIAF